MFNNYRPISDRTTNIKKLINKEGKLIIKIKHA